MSLDKTALAHRGDVGRVVGAVREAGGIDLSPYRIRYLERRVDIRLRELGLVTYRQYADVLLADSEEYAALMDTLMINVTEFFRDRRMWALLRDYVSRELLSPSGRSAGRGTIRIWSAGCATGEEPYSLAMLMQDLTSGDAGRRPTSVTGSDLDPTALAKARLGVYSRTASDSIPAIFRTRFVRDVGEYTFTLSEEILETVRFKHLSLFAESPMKGMDLILCRNVLIYFDRQWQAEALHNLTQSLRRGGLLVLGRSERLAPTVLEQYEVVDGAERIYRKV